MTSAGRTKVLHDDSRTHVAQDFSPAAKPRDGLTMEHMITLLLTLLLATSADPQAATQKNPAATTKAQAADTVTVYRSRTCGCCGKWVQHLKDNGFQVVEHIVERVEDAPNRNRVPEKLRSCHIATVRRYLVEGHVPADVVKDMLKKRPEIEGIAVAGMPAGSPGMESPNPEPYEVIAWTKAGKSWTFAKR